MNPHYPKFVVPHLKTHVEICLFAISSKSQPLLLSLRFLKDSGEVSEVESTEALFLLQLPSVQDVLESAGGIRVTVEH